MSASLRKFVVAAVIVGPSGITSVPVSVRTPGLSTCVRVCNELRRTCQARAALICTTIAPEGGNGPIQIASCVRSAANECSATSQTCKSECVAVPEGAR